MTTDTLKSTSHRGAGGVNIPIALRTQASRRLADELAQNYLSDESRGDQTLSPAQVTKMIHELRVHQIELEMQNEELRRSQEALDAWQEHYLYFYDMAPVGYFTVRESGLIEQANLTAAALLGLDRATLVRQKINHFILPDDQDIFYLMRQKVIGTGEPQSCELRFVKQCGTRLWVHLIAQALPGHAGTSSLRITMDDITDRVLRTNELAGANRMIAYQNVEKGKRADELTVANVELAYQSNEKGKRAAELVVANEELVFQSTEKGKRAEELVIANVELEKNKKISENVWKLSFLDPLTNLSNRRLLGDRLTQTMASSKRTGRHAALMMLDLDNFKPLNDLHGHAVGDLLLIEVSRRLIACVREVDTVARIGGDEFVVVLGELDMDRDKSAEQASEVAEKIRASLSKPYILNDFAGKVYEHHCSASIGVLVFKNHQASQDDLLKFADAAMYQAKVAGRNGVRFYDSKGKL